MNPVNATSYTIKNDDGQPTKTFQSPRESFDDNSSEKSKQKLLLSKIRSFIIVLALSVHSIFEGMAIGDYFYLFVHFCTDFWRLLFVTGLQNSVEDIWKLFAAVAIHECAILFCVSSMYFVAIHSNVL